jgi:hypothetical protein
MKVPMRSEMVMSIVIEFSMRVESATHVTDVELIHADVGHNFVPDPMDGV